MGKNSDRRGQRFAHKTKTLSPKLAPFGPCPVSDLGPLSGEERKLDVGAVRSPFDPERTSGPLARQISEPFGVGSRPGQKKIEFLEKASGGGFVLQK